MFIRNTWYVAAQAPEIIEGEILARTLLNEKIILFRTSEGKVVAMDDACPHRYAPLSMGWIEDDTVRCPYHGARFDCSGKCVEVPGLTGEEPSKAQVKTYPTIERHNFIWIWMGDPDLASDESSIPDWFYPAGHTDWNGGHHKFLSMPVYYELINDNLHDISHTEFVHPETIGSDFMGKVVRLAKGQNSEDMWMERDIQEHSIRLHFHSEDSKVGPLFSKLMASGKGLEKWDDNITFDLIVTYATPGFFCFNPVVREVGAPDEEAVQFRNLNAITPETDTSCHYFFYNANDLNSTDEHMRQHTQFIWDSIEFAFTQDKVLIMEQMKRAPDQGMKTESMVKNSFFGDMVPIMGRRMIRAQLAAEQLATEQKQEQEQATKVKSMPNIPG